MATLNETGFAASIDNFNTTAAANASVPKDSTVNPMSLFDQIKDKILIVDERANVITHIISIE